MSKPVYLTRHRRTCHSSNARSSVKGGEREREKRSEVVFTSQLRSAPSSEYHPRPITVCTRVVCCAVCCTVVRVWRGADGQTCASGGASVSTRLHFHLLSAPCPPSPRPALQEFLITHHCMSLTRVHRPGVRSWGNKLFGAIYW